MRLAVPQLHELVYGKPGHGVYGGGYGERSQYLFNVERSLLFVEHIGLEVLYGVEDVLAYELHLVGDAAQGLYGVEQH